MKLPFGSRSFGRWATVGLLFGLAGVLCAQGFDAGKPQPATGAPKVEAYLGTHFPNWLSRFQIPGACVAVVQRGRVLYAGGFGVADIATRRPVVPDRTLFRLASLSKIFTAAAALELARKGKLDLHRNVNDYLGRFQIAPAFARPVTLHDLLTHSAGFDYRRLKYAAHSDTDRISLANYLEEFQPVRIRPPGEASSYDNYGFALAGYLVQRVAGEPFAQFMKSHWLDPLGMAHTTFVVTNRNQRQLARGYRLTRGRQLELPRDRVNIVPAAGLCSTAADMARFLAALTAGPRTGGRFGFAPSVWAGLTREQFVDHVGVPGRCYGFDEVSLAGRRVLRQSGSWPGFCSLLLYWPGSGLGLFVAYNRNDGSIFAENVCRKILARIAASRSNKPHAIALQNPASADTNTVRFAGLYFSLRYPQYAPSFGFPAMKRVRADGQGYVRVDNVRYREIDRDVFERIDDGPLQTGFVSGRLGFREDAAGRGSELITEKGTFRRATWYELPQTRRVLLIVISCVFILTLAVWPIRGALRLLKSATRDGAPAESGSMDLAARVTAVGASSLGLGAVCVLAVVARNAGSFDYIYGLPSGVVELMDLLPWMMGVGLLLAGLAAWVWYQRVWNFLDRIHFTLVVFAIWWLCLDLCAHNLLAV